jgi:hypothetical protein
MFNKVISQEHLTIISLDENQIRLEKFKQERSPISGILDKLIISKEFGFKRSIFKRLLWPLWPLGQV